jgi:hypothetical protein
MLGECMPSDLELVERVKQRFLAHQDRASRRLIPFNVLEVGEVSKRVTEEALDYLEHRIDPGSTLGASVRPNGICASEVIQLRNVKGEDIDFLVQVRVGKASSGDKATRGYYDRSTNTIVIYLSPWLDSNDLNETRKYDIINTNRNILIHEVTHALDVIDNYKREEGAAYHNNPHEIRAFTRQIVDEASRVLKGLRLTSRSMKRPMPQGAQLIEALLDGSKTWREIRKDLNESNNRYIRQVLVRELDLVV